MRIGVINEAGVERRTSLTRERVVDAAVQLADRDGIDGLSMRRLGQNLDVEAMSLYTHVRNKDDLLDGMVDAVVREIGIVHDPAGWAASLRTTILGARSVLRRHAWAPRVIESRATPGPAVMQYFDGVIGILISGGFSIDLTHHAMHVLGSRVLGFTQELYDDTETMSPEMTAAFAAQLADTLPNVAQMVLAASHEGPLAGCDDDVEFAFALDLTLDGLERLRAA